MLTRRRFKQTISLKDRLISYARETREKADLLPVGRERDQLIDKARQAAAAAHMDDLISSPRLQPPE